MKTHENFAHLPAAEQQNAIIAALIQVRDAEDKVSPKQDLCALMAATNITELHVRHNMIGDAEAITLAEALAHNTTMRVLGVGYNKIGAAGAQALARNTTLTTLDVRFNRIGDAGAEALAANATLRVLNLDGNQIGDAGAQALARNTTLTTLDVADNRIGDAGAQALARNTTLTSLNVASNEIGAAGVEALARNTTLRVLEVGSNGIGAAGKQAIKDMLERNRAGVVMKRDAAYTVLLFNQRESTSAETDILSLPREVNRIIAEKVLDSKDSGTWVAAVEAQKAAAQKAGDNPERKL